MPKHRGRTTWRQTTNLKHLPRPRPGTPCLRLFLLFVSQLSLNSPKRVWEIFILVIPQLSRRRRINCCFRANSHQNRPPCTVSHHLKAISPDSDRYRPTVSPLYPMLETISQSASSSNIQARVIIWNPSFPCTLIPVSGHKTPGPIMRTLNLRIQVRHSIPTIPMRICPTVCSLGLALLCGRRVCHDFNLSL